MNCIDYLLESNSNNTSNFVCGNTPLTFNDCYNQSYSLANYIRNTFGEKLHFILLSENSNFFIIAYLAIIKSGNICIPLDPAIEGNNFNYIVQTTNPALIFTTNKISNKLCLDGTVCLYPEDIPEKSKIHPPLKFEPGFDKERIAEIIFTSGSTGKPKGVMLSHKNLIANTNSILQYLSLSSKDKILVVLPFFYCYGLSLLHTHLRCGGSIVLNNSFIFLGSVIKALKENNCTGFAGVPSHFQILLRKSDSFKKSEFPSLRYVTQAGGKLSTVFIDEFIEAFSNTAFYVMYGQTEATARLSYLPPQKYKQKKGSIGKGIPDVELRVVNSKNNEVAPGEIGEIIAKGDNIMAGYYHDAEGTRKVFRNGWLHTGDLATVDEDGFIYHSARKKEIMKISGKRVSPKEIEEVILKIPAIVDCTIESFEDLVQGEAIKASLVLQNSITNFPEFEKKVKNYCMQNMALYKVPRKFEFKTRMHLSSSGKKVKAKL